ncbi:hypothetical protein ACLOJK_036351 [Asimina triloba]
MSTMLTFRFTPGGGFALGNHKSFDLAIPHQFIYVLASMAQRTYCYVDYSPITIILTTEGNWPKPTAASSAPRPSHKAATSVPQSSRPLRKVISTTTGSAPTLASRPSRKVAIPIATTTSTSASRSTHSPPSISLYAS